MRAILGVFMLGCVAAMSGCQHISDLQACRPPMHGPDLFSDHAGWDHSSVDEVRCSNEELQKVVDARLAREKSAKQS